MSKVQITLTIAQAVQVEVALMRAVWNAEDAERSARRIHLLGCAERRLEDAAHAELVLKEFKSAFDAAVKEPL